jgi:hypothetical protein
MIFLSLLNTALAFPPRGFGSALPDFAFFVIFAFAADTNFRPVAPYTYRWLFFALCVILAVLFFVAWIVDLGAHV